MQWWTLKLNSGKEMRRKMEKMQFEENILNNDDIKNIPASEFEIIGPDTAQSEVIYKPSLTFWQDGWRRFRNNVYIHIFGYIRTKPD